jgi:hypothetical protein
MNVNQPVVNNNNTLWAKYIRACAKVATLQNGTKEKELARRYRYSCWKAYLNSNEYQKLVGIM